MAKVFVSSSVSLIVALFPFVVGAEELNLADFFWPLEPGLVLHYESDEPDDPQETNKLRHTIRILEIRKAPGTGKVTVKTEEEFVGRGGQFTEPFEYVLSSQQSEIRRIAKDENRTMLKGPLAVGTRWPVFYRSQEYVDGKPKRTRKLKATCSIADIKTEERLNKSTICLRVACTVKPGRASFTDNFHFCKGLGYFGFEVYQASGETFWQERLTSIEPKK